MADVIDDLQLKIEASARGTAKIQKLVDQLNNLVDPVQRLTAMSSSLGNFSENLRSLSNIDLSKTANGLRRMSSNMEGMSKASSYVGKALGTLSGSVSGGLKSAVSMYGKVLGGLASGLKSIGSTGVSAVSKLTGGLRGLVSMRSGIGGLSSSIKLLLGTVIGFRGITGAFNWLKDAVSAGADVAEINHIVESTFRDMSGYVEGWAADAIENYGIAANAAKRYAGTLSAMFQASGASYKEAAKMSTDLVGLAGDLSSYFNIDTETAYSKIKSGMAGMVRPLRDLGIDLTAATLKEYALSQGITKSYSSMTQAEKVMLRYQYLMSVTTNQQGDFARTSLSLANSLRVLRAYASAVTSAIGEGMAAALRHVVHLLNAVMKYVLKAAQAFATFMNTIFGKNISGGGISVDTSDFDDAADSMGDLDDSAGSAADGISDADSAAKKLKKDLAVLPFDELNQLNKDQESTSSSGGAGGSGGSGGSVGGLDTGMLDLAADAFKNSDLPEAVSEWGERIRKAFESKDWIGLGKAVAWGLNKGIDAIYDILNPAKVRKKVTPFINAFVLTFNSLVDSIKWNKLGRALGRGITDLIYIANTTIEGINWKNLGKKLAQGSNGLVTEIDWDGLGRLFANKFNMLWGVANGWVHEFNWSSLGKSLSKGANGFIGQIDFHMLADTVSTGLNGVADAFNNLLDPKKGINFKLLGTKLSTALSGMVSTGIKWDHIGTLLANGWNGVWTFFKSFVQGLGDGEAKKGTGIGKAIHDVLESAIGGIKVDDMVDTLTTLVKKISDDIIAIFGDTAMWVDLGTKIGAGISGLLTDADMAEQAGNAINSITSALLEMFKSAFKELENHKTEIGDAVKTLFESIDWMNVLKLAAPIIGFKLALGIGAMSLDSVKKALELKLVGMFSSVLGGQTITQTVTTSASTIGTTLSTAVASGALESAAMWSGPLGIIGLGIIGAIWGNTPEGKAQMASDKAAFNEDVKDGLNEVENAFYGTGTNIETLNKEVAQNAIKTTEETKQQLSASLTAMQRAGILTESEFRSINAQIYQGNQDTIESVKELRDAWLSGDTDKINSAKEAATATVDTQSSVNAAFDGTKTKANELKDTMLEASDAAKASKDDIDNYHTEANKTPSILDVIGQFVTGFGKKLINSLNKKEDYKSAGENISDGVKEGIEKSADDAYNAVEALSSGMVGRFNAFNKINSPSGLYEEQAGYIPEGVKEGIADKTETAVSAIESMIEAMLTMAEQKMDDLKSHLDSMGEETIAEGLGVGLERGFESFSLEDMVDGAFSSVDGIMSEYASSFYEYGSNIASSFSSGMSSMHIELPCITASWSRYTYGNGGWFDIPNFNLEWHKNGGLFTKATIAGFGEAGDEAALPLENKRVMSKIANSIVEAGGNGMGMGADEMREAVATGVAMAMAQNPQTIEVIVNSVLKTNDEALAQSVSRGQAKIDRRYNPTPQFSN